MPITDAQRARLPKAVQHELSRLEAAVEYYKQMATQGPEDSNTFAHAVPGGKDTPLGRSRRIEFRQGGEDQASHRTVGNQIEAYMDSDGDVVIMCDNTLSVMPWSSNMIKVRSVDRFRR